MNKCQFCGNELPAYARFCNKCGQSQVTKSGVDNASVPPVVSPKPQQEDVEEYNMTWISAPPVVAANPPSTPMPAPPPPPPPSTGGKRASEEERQWPVPPVVPSSLTPNPASNNGIPHTNFGQPQQPLHLQPQYNHAQHQQPVQMHSTHEQPFNPQQAYPQSAPHHQPYPQHGLHQQPQMVHGLHQQPHLQAGLHAHAPHMAGAGAKAVGVGAKVGGSVLTKWLVVTVIAALVLGGGGTAIYAFTRPPVPQPAINVTSSYKVNNVPAASDGTTIHIKGNKFSGGSPITFLLDGKPLPGAPTVKSTSDGDMSVDLPVTSSWSVGKHTITAKDADDHETNIKIDITVVNQGEAHTPGPHGAPADDQSFSVSVKARITLNGYNNPYDAALSLTISGHPDPQGGTVCGEEDDQKEHSIHDTTLDTNMAFTKTYSYSCTGSYKTGKLTYTKRLLSEKVVFDQGGTCTLKTAQDFIVVKGEFNESKEFSGTVTADDIPSSGYTCDSNVANFSTVGVTGTWTGKADVSGNSGGGQDATPTATDL